MHDAIGSPGRAARGVLLVAILAATVAPATSVALAADASPEPGASTADAPSGEVVHGWPGARRNPDGLYSWTGGPRWMHNVTHAGAPVEIIFGEADEAWAIPVEDIASASVDLDGPFVGRPVHVADTRLQAWLLDLDGDRVAILVKSFTDSDPALVVEAEAIIESIRVDRSDAGVPRLVFRLLEGWDSG
jgi:hypothetical protein